MTPDPKAVVLVTRRFRSSPESVFDSWLDPAKIAVWMLGPAPGEAVRNDVDPRIGGKFCFVVRRQGEQIEHVGEYLEFERPRRLVFTWGVPAYSKDKTVVSLDLLPLDAGTELTLTHQGVLPEYEERTAKGWTTILAAIASTLGER